MVTRPPTALMGLGEAVAPQARGIRLPSAIIWFLLLLVMTAHLSAADLNVLMLGSTESFSEEAFYAGEASVNNEQPFNPQLVANELQAILSGNGFSANVTFEDIYTTSTRYINYGGDDQTRTYSLQGYFYHPAGRDAFWESLKNNSGTQWDYIVILEDPSIITNTPGVYANGVRLIVNKIREGSPQAQPLLMMQWGDPASSVAVDHFGEVTYRVGDSGGVPVAPAGYAWNDLASKDSGTHPTPHGAYLAAATLYTTMLSGNATASSYTYDDDLASLAYGTVQTHAAQSHYTGLYDTLNPYLILNEKDRVIKSVKNGSSTVSGLLDYHNYSGGRYFKALLNPELRIHDYSEDPDGFSGKTHFHIGRNLHETTKRYAYTPSTYRYAMGFTYQVRNLSGGSDSDFTPGQGQWDMLYGMDYLDNAYGYEYDRGDSRMSFLMIKQNRVADGVRNIPIHALWASVNVEMGNSTPFTDTRHYGADMNEATVSYMMTLLTGRCPIGKNGTATERERQRIGYEHAWVMSTLNLRPPGFTTFPSAASAKTVSTTANETMEVYFINAPESTVTVDVSLSANTAALVNPKTLTFTTSNYDTVQNVTVRGLDGSSASEAFDVQFQTTSNDVNYNSLTDSWAYTNTREFPVSGATLVELADQSLTVGKNSRLSIDLGVAGATEESVVLLGPSQGNLSWINSSNVLYVPGANVVGVDSFAFSLVSGTTVTKGYVAINIADEPQLVFVESGGNTSVEEAGPTNDTYTVALNKAPSHDVTVNLTTPDGQTSVSPTPLTFTSGDWSTPQTVTVTAVVDGTPDATSVGSIFHATSSANTSWNGLSNHVYPLVLDDDNAVPVASGNSVETVMDVALPIVLVATDGDADPLTYTIVASPSHGTLSGTAPNLTYTPDSGYVGNDQFSFRVNDGTINSNTATVSIVVSNAPVATSTVAATSLNTPVAFTLSASDADGDSLSYTRVSEPANGFLSGTEPNLTYTPNANWSGSDNVSFYVNDGVADSNTATVSIHVSSGNLITVQNQSFEDGGLDNSNQPPWKLSNGSTSIKVDEANDLVGKIDPSPDGTSNYGYSYSTSHSFYQVLSETLEAEMTYTLSVDIGDRTDNVVTPGPNLHLGYVSDSPTAEDDWGLNLLAATVVSNTIPVNDAGATDGWERWVSTFTTGPSPAGEGKALRIELESMGGIILWDNVRFEKVSSTQVLPYVSVSAIDQNAAEQGSDTGTWLISHDGFSANALTVNFTLGGTATEVDDYSVTANTSVTIGAGSTNTIVTLTPVDDAVFAEHGEQAELTISASSNYAIFTATDNIIIVENDNNAPVVNAGSDQAVLLSGSSAPDPIAGADIFLDAGTDDGVNATWEANIGTWEPTYTGTVTWVADAGSSLPGITSAYDFPGGGFGTDGFEGTSIGDLGHNTTPVTVEIWFKPDATSGHPTNGQILYETGGGTGLGIFYTNGVVETSHDSNQSEISYDVTSLVNEFIQVVITYDTAGGADAFKLYINGDLKSSTAFDDNNICGGDAAGLGARGETNAGGRGSNDAETESFDGKIAIFRTYFNKILSATEVQENYDSIALNAVASANLIGSATDADSDPMTTTWTKVSGTGNVTFADSANVITTANFDSLGTYVLRLSADDGSDQTADDVTITVTDNLSSIVLVEESSLSIGEGTSGNISIKLSGIPTGDVHFALTRTSGDSDLIFNSGNTLTFTTSNWSNYQYIQLDAEEDDGETFSGNATFSIYKISGNGSYSSVEILVSEIDDDINLTVNSDGNGTVTGGGVVDLIDAPYDIIATPDTNYAFDSWSGNTGVIANLSGNSTTISTNVSETITANFISTVPMVVVESDPVSVAEGSSNVIRVKLIPSPTADLTLGFQAVGGGDGDLTISTNTVVITSGNTNWHDVTVDGAEDGDTTSGNTLFNIYKVSGVNPLINATVDVMEIDDDIFLTILSAGNGSVSGGGIVEKSGSPYNIVATPISGYEFVSWSGNIGALGNISGNSTTLTTSHDETITATFQWIVVYETPAVLVGGNIRNGNFNASAIDNTNYTDTDEWYNLLGDQGTQCTRTNLDQDGTSNAILSSGKQLAINTDHTIAEGDKFDVSYVWRDAFNWVDGSDRVKVSLFVTSDNTFNGTRMDLIQDLSETSVSDSAYQSVDHNEFYTATESDTGKILFMVIETDSVGFARIDDVELIVTSLSTTVPAGITVSSISGNTNENGGTATFTIVLDSEPSANVTIGISSSNTSEVTVSPSTLVFSSGNWNSAATVTLTGVDDTVVDGTATVTIVTAAVTSLDGSYNGLNPGDVSVDNLDDSVTLTVNSSGAGTTSSSGSGLVEPDVYTDLTATANVGYSFVNWSGQTTGLTDANASSTNIQPTGDQTITANFSLNTVVLVSDNLSLNVAEGGSNTLRFKLSAEPTSSVSVTISNTAGDSDLSVSGSPLSFTTGNWGDWQSVSVSAAQDWDAIHGIATVTATSTAGTNVITVSEVDDDSGALEINLVLSTLSENGGATTGNVVRNTDPTSSLEVTLSTNDQTELASPGNITIPAGNIYGVFTLNGVDDLVTDGSQLVNLTGNATNFVSANVNVTVTDDDVPGITVSAVSGNTDEDGGTATFTIVLDSEPSANVTMGISSSNTSEVTVSPSALIFSSGNWNSAATVTLTGVDDTVVDGTATVTIVTAAVTSLDGSYSGLNPADVSVDNRDDSVTLTVNSSGAGTTSPSGSGLVEPDVYTDLTATANVGYSFVNWSGQTTGLTDTNASSTNIQPTGDQTITANFSLNTVVLVSDNLSLNVAEGGSNTLRFKLSAEPTSSVSVTISNTAGDSDLSVSGSPLSFTTGNWGDWQSVSVSAAQDWDAINGSATVTATSTAGTNVITVSEVDDDSAGLEINLVLSTLSENGGATTGNVVRNTDPSSTLEVTLSSNDLTELSSPGNITIPAGNIYGVFTLNGVDDLVLDGDKEVTLTANATNFSSASANVSVMDDEGAGITVSPVSGNTTEDLDTATFTVVLDTAPSSDVSIAVGSSDTSEVTVFPSTLVFTSANWNSPATVTLTGVDDSVADGTVSVNIVIGAAVSLDGTYNGMDVADFTVDNLDDAVTLTVNSGVDGSTSPSGSGLVDPDASTSLTATADTGYSFVNWTGQTTGIGDANATSTTIQPAGDQTVQANFALTGLSIVVESSMLNVSEGSSNTFRIKLSTEPASDIDLLVFATGGDSDLTPSGGNTLTIVSGNWNTWHEISIQSIEDNGDTSSDNTLFKVTKVSGLNSVIGGLCDVWEVDDDITLVVGHDGNGNTMGSGIVDKDNSPYTITATPNSGFTFLNWSGNTGVMGSTTSSTTTVFTTTDETITANFSLTSLAVEIETDPVSISEGGSGIIRVRLSGAPVGDTGLAIAYTSGDTDITVGTSSVTFTTANWNVWQDITVSAAQDADLVDDTTNFTISQTSGVSTVNSITATVKAGDDDSASYAPNISTLTLGENDSGSFTVVLGAQPQSDVVLLVVSSDTAEATVSNSTLTFTTANWNLPQTVTITGIDDSHLGDDGAVVTVSVVTASSDDKFDVLADKTVDVTLSDDDAAGFTLSTNSLGINRNGGVGSFTVVLDSQPASDVVISVSSDNLLEATVSLSSLTFTNVDWNLAQSVAVTGVDNLNLGANVAVISVSVEDASSNDAFDPLADKTVNVTLFNNNTAPVIDQSESLSVTMAEDGTLSLSSLGTISAMDVEGDSLIWSVGSQGANGTALASGNLNTLSDLSYTPDTDWNGVDSFVVKVSDGSDSDTIQVNVEVLPVNDAPTVAGNVIDLDEYTVHIVRFSDLGYDDVERDAMNHIRIVSLPADGVVYRDGVVISEGDVISLADIDLGKFSYQAGAGPDVEKLGFTGNDGNLDSEVAEITFNVADKTAPTVLASYPTTGSRIYGSTVIGIRFSEVVDAVDATNPINYVLSGGAAGGVTVLRVSGTGAGIYTLELTNTLKAGSVKITIGSIRDLSGNPMVGAHEVNFQVQPPIKVVEEPLVALGGESYLWLETETSITDIVVDDPSIVDINREDLTYRGLNAGTTTVTLTDENSNTYSMTITVRSPNTNSTDYQFNDYNNGAGYRMVTFPYFLSGPDKKLQLLSMLQQKLGQMSNSNYLLYVYDNVRQSYVRLDEYGGEVNVGMGFWMASLYGTAFDLSAFGPSNPEVVAVNLVPGWNIIGNPYTVALPTTNIYYPMGDVSIPVPSGNQQVLGHHFWYIEDGYSEHESLGTLQVGQGAWIYNSSDRVEKIIFHLPVEGLAKSTLVESVRGDIPMSELDLEGEPLPPASPKVKVAVENSESSSVITVAPVESVAPVVPNSGFSVGGGGGGGGCLLR